MSTSEESTRPISVAELLARNGTIGAPPPSGHRRRRRTGGISVAELTGEIPVIRTGEIQIVHEDVVSEEGPADPDQVVAEAVHDEHGSGEPASQDGFEPEPQDEPESQHEPEPQDEQPAEDDARAAAEAAETPAAEVGVDYQDHPEGGSSDVEDTQVEDEPAEVEAGAEVQVDDNGADAVEADSVQVEADEVEADEVDADEVESGQGELTQIEDAQPESGEPDSDAPPPPPKSRIPLPRRVRGLERSHDPRPLRRSRPARGSVNESTTTSGTTTSGTTSSSAEQMNYDPVDEPGSVAELVGQPGVEELRSYLQSSAGTLFSGETVADDLARRGAAALVEKAGGTAANTATASKPVTKNAGPQVPRPKESPLTSFRHGAVAVLQSTSAVALGAGLFIAFDQLWRWNNIVALVLSVLVILGLVVAVRVVRKTEDILSTLIAVVVGALVTLGPLALLQSI